MNVRQSFLLAIKSLKQSKLRSFLTMLGIIVGVASVFAMLTVMNTYKNAIYKSFEEYDKGLVSLYSTSSKDQSSKIKQLIKDYPNYFKEYVEYTETEGVISDGFKEVKTNVIAAPSSFIELSFYKDDDYVFGHNFNYIDDKDGNNKCIITLDYSKYFFGDDNPVGEKITINGKEYVINGVTDKKYNYSQVIVPYNNLKNNTYGSQAYILLNKKSDTEKAMMTLKNEIKKRNIKIEFFSTEEGLNEVFAAIDIVKYILVAIAGISLFVGGIGIMNIMLVTVTERIKEIGIRKSLGANPKEILTQFLIEAATVSLIGGLIGIILGVLMSFGIIYFIQNIAGEDLPIKITITSVLVSSLSSILIGIIFGYFPARKASKMDPIDALSYE